MESLYQPSDRDSVVTYLDVEDLATPIAITFPTRGTVKEKPAASSFEDSSTESSDGDISKHHSPIMFDSLSFPPEKPLPSIPSRASTVVGVPSDEKKVAPLDTKRFDFASSRNPFARPTIRWKQNNEPCDLDSESDYGYMRDSEASFVPGLDDHAIPIPSRYAAAAAKGHVTAATTKAEEKSRDDKAPRSVHFTKFANMSESSVSTLRMAPSGPQGRSTSHPELPQLARIRSEMRISRGVEVPLDSPPPYDRNSAAGPSAGHDRGDVRRPFPKGTAFLNRPLGPQYFAGRIVPPKDLDEKTPVFFDGPLPTSLLRATPLDEGRLAIKRTMEKIRRDRETMARKRAMSVSQSTPPALGRQP